MPKIDLSIITITYNAEKFIGQTIESIANQTFDNLEYIVIDGQSMDQTLEIIHKNKKYINLFKSEPDNGVYDAMNKGLSLAKGKYVLFINAGDELADPEVLERIFKNKTDADLFYGETNIMNKNHEIIGTRTRLTSRKLPENLTKKDFLQGQVVSHQSFIPKRSLCRPYNLKYLCSADIDWMLQIMSQAKTIINVGHPISNYLQGGISDNQLITCWKERLYILFKYFNFFSVVSAHIKFGIRFLRWGRYK